MGVLMGILCYFDGVPRSHSVIGKSSPLMIVTENSAKNCQLNGHEYKCDVFNEKQMAVNKYCKDIALLKYQFSAILLN